MKIAPMLLCFIGASAFAAAAGPNRSPAESASLFRLWEKVRAPASGDPSPIGSYSAGCLGGAAKLPLDGAGYAVMRPSRLRYFGHPSLVTYIQDLSQRTHAAGLPLLLVGDMGRPRGGPMRSGHASHQIGLDVDLWYRMLKDRPRARDRERLSAEHLVRPDGTPTRGWTDQGRRLVELAASDERVDRIFVHAGLKRDLCAKFPGAAWLAKLRPWWGHDDHLHVRLKCPAGSAACAAQDPVAPAPDGGCGTELAWWFSPEAREEGAKKFASARPFPELPPACNRMIAEFGGAK